MLFFWNFYSSEGLENVSVQFPQNMKQHNNVDDDDDDDDDDDNTFFFYYTF